MNRRNLIHFFVRILVMEKSNDITKLKLAYAMRECMEKETVEEITVREICKKSSFSRQTFYRCFIDKYDLINWYFDRILHESFNQMGKGRTIRESLILKFNYIQQELVFFKAGFQSDDVNNLKEHDFKMIFAFYQNLIEEKSGEKPDKRIKDILEMYCQSSVYMTVEWITGHNQNTSEGLADMMIDAMPYKLSKLFVKLNILD